MSAVNIAQSRKARDEFKLKILANLASLHEIKENFKSDTKKQRSREAALVACRQNLRFKSWSEGGETVLLGVLRERRQKSGLLFRKLASLLIPTADQFSDADDNECCNHSNPCC
ncbi:MAG: hypothetical protein KDH97_07320 [Calditrichaeota bacterium]|nr:hypothetical protein [Calditrichota bacterium]